jgi:putative transposase
MDFMLDSLLDGRRIRMLTVVDIFSRLSPIIETDRSLNGQKVVRALQRATRRYSCPEVIQVDNGSEFQSKAPGRLGRRASCEARLHTTRETSG